MTNIYQINRWNIEKTYKYLLEKGGKVLSALVFSPEELELRSNMPPSYLYIDKDWVIIETTDWKRSLPNGAILKEINECGECNSLNVDSELLWDLELKNCKCPKCYSKDVEPI